MRYGGDLVVVGAGNAGLSAALRASQLGAKVHVIEKAPKRYRGGNSSLASNMRFSFNDWAEVAMLLPTSERARLKSLTLPCYQPEEFLKDLLDASSGRADYNLSNALAHESRTTVEWLRSVGHKWTLRKHLSSGTPPVQLEGGGVVLQDRNFAIAEDLGVEVHYETELSTILVEGGVISGVGGRCNGEEITFNAPVVLLSCGGFQANAEMRKQHLGDVWENVALRGVPYNTGDGHRLAISVGASMSGDWSAVHASPQDIDLPDQNLPGSHFTAQANSRYSFPFGVMVNLDGNRFCDEGEHFGNYTYARLGSEILRQRDKLAYQIFDDKAARTLLKGTYYLSSKTVTADSITKLADNIGVPAKNLSRTIHEFNSATTSNGATNLPFELDSRKTVGITPPKSNWASPITEKPFWAFPVTGGLTFTFGGIGIDRDARVLDVNGIPIQGLYAAGEIVGGLFYRNYPGGAGMAAGATFGRLAAEHAF